MHPARSPWSQRLFLPHHKFINAENCTWHYVETTKLEKYIVMLKFASAMACMALAIISPTLPLTTLNLQTNGETTHNSCESCSLTYHYRFRTWKSTSLTEQRLQAVMELNNTLKRRVKCSLLISNQ